MPTTTQLVIYEESKAGTLAKVASALGAAGVNIKAFSAPEVTGKGKLRVLVSDLARARAALKAQKSRFREETALVLGLENKPGALSEATEHLTRAGQYQVWLLYAFPRRATRDRCTHGVEYSQGSQCSQGKIPRQILKSEDLSWVSCGPHSRKASSRL